MTRRQASSFLSALERAQQIAFAPFTFQAAAAAMRTGFLEYISRHPGISPAAAAEACGLTPYAAGVLADLLLAAGVLEPAGDADGTRDAGLRTTATGDLLVYDDMTRVNFFFTADACWPGLDKSEAALREGRPAGLAAFDPSWTTIYPHLPHLPPAAKKAWFDFDHYHSDRAYEAAIAEIRTLCGSNGPCRLADIGGNTGRFTRRFLLAFPEASAVVVDLPAETETLPSRPELAAFADRLETHAIDWLTPAPLTGMEGTDLFWMSQFLDCFSEDQALSILRRTRDAMPQGARLLVLEPLTDEQRHKAAEISLAATNLYFTVLANGVSRFFEGRVLRRLFDEAGFTITLERPGLGITHTLFVLEPKR